MKTACKILVGLLFSSISVSSIAATSTVAEDTWKLVRPRSDVVSLGPDLFGDSSSIYTGATEFRVTDVSIPGNSSLPVSLGRKFSVSKGSADPFLRFGDWDYDLPYLSGNFVGQWEVSTPGQPNNRCSVDVNSPSNGAPRPVTVYAHPFNVTFSSSEYWQGNSLYIPGNGSSRLMVISASNNNRPASGDYRWVTKNNWLVSCLPSTANQYPGEAFLVRSPDGTTYWFDWFTHMISHSIQKSAGPNGEALAQIGANEVRIYPTKIVDRFGNQVTYTYETTNPDGYPALVSNRLKSIVASDGRQITINYNSNGKVMTAVANGRTWTYEYDANKRLKKVVLPDESSWEYSIESLSSIDWLANHANCAEAGSYHPSIWAGTIKHPSGATGSFTFQRKRLGRSYVPKECYGGSVPLQTSHMDVASIIRKEIAGPSTLPRIWEFDYGAFNGSYDWDCNNSGGCPTTRTTTITENSQRWTRHTISNRYGPLEGKTLKTEYGDTSGTHRIINYGYLTDSTGQLFPSKIGTLPCYRCDRGDETLAPIKTVEILQSGDSFKKTINRFDRFARNELVQSQSTLGYSKIEFSSFHDDLNLWVIGQPRLSYVQDASPNGLQLGSNMISGEIGYNSLAQSVWKKKFGKLAESLTYHPDGTLATVTDGRGNVTTISNWKRGVPGRIDFPPTPEAPSGAFATATIDDNGWVTSITDETEATTGYGYDAMGRLASIVQPTITPLTEISGRLLPRTGSPKDSLSGNGASPKLLEIVSRSRTWMQCGVLSSVTSMTVRMWHQHCARQKLLMTAAAASVSSPTRLRRIFLATAARAPSTTRWIA
jgi:YD repeat-containing protein